MRILELCSGYGTSTFALKMLGINHKLIGYSDIDKYANQCFQQNHGGNELGDMTKINISSLPNFDLLTCGFPCQDVSVAGKQDLSKGRTIIGYYLKDYLSIKKPKYFLFENVKGLLSKKFKPFLDELLKQWDEAGYNVYWKLLNTKEHGIPQNRERVFFVGFRKDIDPGNFEFPEKEELKIFLKDILENEVDDKYYLSEEQIDRLLFRTQIEIPETEEPYAFDVYNKKIKQNGISPTLTEPHHNSLRLLQCLRIKNATKKGYLNAFEGDGISLEHPDSKTRRGRVQSKIISTLQCNDARGVVTKELTIRKLTPVEYFRLQGFINDEINIEGLSDTQQYKLAGNGQSVNVVSKIFERMFYEHR